MSAADGETAASGGRDGFYQNKKGARVEPSNEKHTAMQDSSEELDLDFDFLDLDLDDLCPEKEEQRVLDKSEDEIEGDHAEAIAERNRRSKSPPDQNRFANPFVHQGWLRYFRSLLVHCEAAAGSGPVSAENLPNSITGFDRGLVALHLGKKRESEPSHRLDVLKAALRSRRFVILGGPGSGKTCTALRVAACLAAGSDLGKSRALANMIPLLFDLRDFSVSSATTFQDLLAQFQLLPFWPGSDAVSPKELKAALKNGQGFLIFDGIDSIAGIEKRKVLRKTVLIEGMEAYPDCVWMLTSRIAGYGDAPFDGSFFTDPPLYFGYEKKVETPVVSGQINQSGMCDLYWMQPPDEGQAEALIKTRSSIFMKDSPRWEEQSDELHQAVSDSPMWMRIDKDPQRLVFFADAGKPLGGSLRPVDLFENHIRARLGSVACSGSLCKEQREDRIEKCFRLLASLAFDSQLTRQEAEDGEHIEDGELVFSESRAKRKIEEIFDEGDGRDRVLAELEQTCRLLTCPMPGRYRFSDLSIQEYLASAYLLEGVARPERRKATLARIRQYAGRTVWGRSLALLFERLAETPGLSDWLFDRLFENADPSEAPLVRLAATLAGDSRIGICNKRSQVVATLAIERTDRQFDGELLCEINCMPEKKAIDCFAPVLKAFFAERARDGVRIGPDLLLFLQSMDALGFSTLESVLAETVLWDMEDEDLFYLLPCRVFRKGPAYRELLLRMPLGLWFFEFDFGCGMLPMPASRFLERRDFWKMRCKEDFLAWGARFRLLSDMLLLKMLMVSHEKFHALSLTRAHRSEWPLDLDWALDRHRSWLPGRTRPSFSEWLRSCSMEELSCKGPVFENMDIAHSGNDSEPVRERNLARRRAFLLARCLDRSASLERMIASSEFQDWLSFPLVSGKSDLASIVAEALACGRRLVRHLKEACKVDDVTCIENPDHVRARIIESSRLWSERMASRFEILSEEGAMRYVCRDANEPMWLRLVRSFFSGRKEDPKLEPPRPPDDSSPLWLAYRSLATLVLGEGGAEDWRAILRHAETLRRPEWINRRLPFIRPGELDYLLKFFGICENKDGPLFIDEWFEPDHKFAPGLNAKPSEMAQAVSWYIEEH